MLLPGHLIDIDPAPRTGRLSGSRRYRRGQRGCLRHWPGAAVPAQPGPRYTPDTPRIRAASRRAAARLAQFLESGCTPRSGRRLDRALDHVNTLVLAFDGRLASPLIDGRVAEHLQRSAFDHEQALVTLASASRRLAAGHPPSEVLYLIIGQLRAIAADRESDAAAIRRAACRSSRPVRFPLCKRIQPGHRPVGRTSACSF